MKNRFVFGLGLALGFVIGGVNTAGKLLSVDEIRKACADRAAKKISDFLYGKDYVSIDYDLSFATQADCENAWNDICELIRVYGMMRVSDMLELTGMPSTSYYDTKTGWTSMIGMYLKPEKDGTWTIHLPKPVRL